jgi:hypothetical protein
MAFNCVLAALNVVVVELLVRHHCISGTLERVRKLSRLTHLYLYSNKIGGAFIVVTHAMIASSRL